VRRILDAGGLREVTIFASGSIDEYVIERVESEVVPIDGFGVGTHMDTSADMPYLDCAYKIQEYAGLARRKRSEGKATWPGRKQVYRVFDDDGRMQADTLTLADDRQPGTPLIQPVMQAGTRLGADEALSAVRARVGAQLRQLPPALARLAPAPPYPVAVAAALRRLADEVDARQPG